MKKNIKYNEIGNLHLFKPDYIAENKKSFLSLNLIKEFLTERRGKQFFKVNFIKNNFSIKKIENTDIVNKKMELKIIEQSYREMKSQFYKRLLNEQNFENDKSIFINYKNYICPNSRNKSRNTNIFKNMHIPDISENNAYKKSIRFRKNYSENNMDFFRTNKELKSKLISSMIDNMGRNKNIKLKSLKNKYLTRFQNNISKILNENSNLKGNRTEINYYTINDKLKGEKIFLSSVDIKNKNHSAINNVDTEDINPFLPISNEQRLRKQYNFFRLNIKSNMNKAMNKFNKFQNILTSRRNKKPNGKFHINYVHYVIDNIKRKERAEKLSRRIKYNNKIFNATVHKNQSYIHKRNENNFYLNKFKSFYNEINKAQ